MGDKLDNKIKRRDKKRRTAMVLDGLAWARLVERMLWKRKQPKKD